LCGVGHVPEAVADQSGYDRKQREDQSRVARVKSDKQREAAERLRSTRRRAQADSSRPREIRD
jgi:hypothetical protein